MKEKKYFFKRVLAGALASMLCLNPLLGAGIAYADDVQTEPQKHKVTVETEGVDNARVVFKGTDKTELEFKEGEKFQLEIKKDNADDQIFPTDIKATDEKGKDISETLKVGEEPFSFVMPNVGLEINITLQNFNVDTRSKRKNTPTEKDLIKKRFSSADRLGVPHSLLSDKGFWKTKQDEIDYWDQRADGVEAMKTEDYWNLVPFSPSFVDGLKQGVAVPVLNSNEKIMLGSLKPNMLARDVEHFPLEDLTNIDNSGAKVCWTGLIRASSRDKKYLNYVTNYGRAGTLFKITGITTTYYDKDKAYWTNDSLEEWSKTGGRNNWSLACQNKRIYPSEGEMNAYVVYMGKVKKGVKKGYNLYHMCINDGTAGGDFVDANRQPLEGYFAMKPKPQKASVYVDVKKGLWGSTNKFANNAYGASKCMSGAEIGLYDSDNKTLLHTFKMDGAGKSDGAYKLGTKKIGLKQSFYLREISAPKYTIINNGDYGRVKSTTSYKCSVTYGKSAATAANATKSYWSFHNIPRATEICLFKNTSDNAPSDYLENHSPIGTEFRAFTTYDDAKKCADNPSHTTNRAKGDPSVSGYAKSIPTEWVDIPDAKVVNPWDGTEHNDSASAKNGTYGWAPNVWKNNINNRYQAWFCGLPQGKTYYIAETKTNGYYERSKEVIKVYVPFSEDNRPNGNTIYARSKNKPVLTYVRVNKESAKPECTNENSNYSLDGAQYGLYRDSACKNPVKQMKDSKNVVLTTNANGVAESAYLEDVLQDDVIYAKEIKASRGYELDDTVHTININKWSSNYKCYYGEFTSKEPVLVDPFNALVKKVNADGVSRPLTGAKFQIDYYGVNVQNVSGNASESTLEGLIKGKNPTRKWVFKTNRNGVMDAADKSLFVPGESDKLWYDKKGHPSMPQGIYTIKEIKAPNGFSLNKKVYTRLVHPASGENEFIETSEINEKSLSLKLKKRQGYYNGLDKEKNDILLEGAEFKHIRPNKKAQTYKTDKNGYIQINGLDDGKHVLYETKAPEGYKVNPIKIEFEVVAPNGNGERIIKYDKSKYGKETADGKVEISLFNDTDRQGVVCLVEETPKEYDFKVRKVNDLNLPLRGAVFGIADNIEMKNAKELTSSVIGEVNFEDLRPGTEYYFAELDAPAGYRPVITKDGKMKVWKFKVVKDNPRDDKFRFEFTDTETGNTTVVDTQNKESGNVKLKGSRDKRVVEFKCVNARTHKLPGTGSKALPIILLISGGCIVAAVILKKKNK